MKTICFVSFNVSILSCCNVNRSHKSDNNLTVNSTAYWFHIEEEHRTFSSINGEKETINELSYVKNKTKMQKFNRLAEIVYYKCTIEKQMALNH